MRKVFSPSAMAGFREVFNLKYLAQGIYQYWYQIALLILFVVIISRKDMSFQFNLSTVLPDTSIARAAFQEEDEKSVKAIAQPEVNMEIASGLWNAIRQEKNAAITTQATAATTSKDNLANTYSNMTYGEKGESTQEKARKLKLLKQNAYVGRFAHVAKIEMKKFGIPASITLAQGLIESNAGESRLATQNNNHFGMKCFSSKCQKGHCSNFTDDSHKDFFRKYGTAWESFRSHSLMLQGKRYRHLKKLKADDYEGWAHGLKKAGYATDRRYAEKLIQIIRELKLHEFDKE